MQDEKRRVDEVKQRIIQKAERHDNYRRFNGKERRKHTEDKTVQKDVKKKTIAGWKKKTG